MRSIRLAIVAAALMALAALASAAGCSGGNNSKDAGPDACDGCGTNDDGPISCTSIGECPVHNLCLGGLCQLGTICTGADGECPDTHECNVMKEVCVPKWSCEQDADCTAENPDVPHCLQGDGVCVECTPATQVTDCGPAGEFLCNGSYECEPVGPDCSSDADCAQTPGQPHCDQGQGICVACLIDDHCDGALVCKFDSHICVECYTDAHCFNLTPQCWEETNTCVECTDNVHCSGDERCNEGTHECTDLVCATDADCADQAGTHCNQATGDCVQCTDDAHCGALQWCREFACESGCETDAECEAKQGAGYRCEDETCFYAECLEDGDCAGNENGEHCKLVDVPNNPAQYTCVQCTDDAHCDEYFECAKGTGQFFCRPMPCYQYQDPQATCAQIDDCYECNYGSGACEPRYDCANDPCCQGYTCNALSHCERNLNCATNADCAADSICNQETLQCEYQSCCDPECQAGYFCNSDSCQCEQGECKQLLESCSTDIQNCCEGLRCAAFFNWCVQN